MKKITTLLLAAALLMPMMATAASGGAPLLKAPIDINDKESLRRGAKAFADFMISGDTQKRISSFGVAKFGSPLFTPDAGKKLESLGQ